MGEHEGEVRREIRWKGWRRDVGGAGMKEGGRKQGGWERDDW